LGGFPLGFTAMGDEALGDFGCFHDFSDEVEI
jgi:hypothetical protein